MSQIRYHANCLHFSAYFSAVMNGGIKFIVPYRWLLCVSHSQVWVISTWKNLESMHNIICITKRVQHQKVCNPCILLSHQQSASWNDLTCNTAGCLWVDLNIHIKRDEREREKLTFFVAICSISVSLRWKIFLRIWIKSSSWVSWHLARHLVDTVNYRPPSQTTLRQKPLHFIRYKNVQASTVNAILCEV